MSRWERSVIRTMSGIVMLLWLAFPVCLIAALWQNDGRWAATGVISLASGAFIAAIMTNGGKK